MPGTLMRKLAIWTILTLPMLGAAWLIVAQSQADDLNAGDHHGLLVASDTVDGEQRYALRDAPALFATSHPFGTGSDRTFALAFGDADNDGDLDLALGNHAPNQVCWNNGDGTYDCEDAFGGSPTFDVEWGDLDGDGYLDLVVANSMSRPNLVCLNNRDRTFTCTAFSLCSGPGEVCSVALGDMDNDGDQDIALGTLHASDVIYFNDGDGTFPITATTCYSGWTFDLGLGDVDDDRDLDLAVTGYNPDYVCINNGNGTFTETRWLTYRIDRGTQGIALGDADGDGDLDIAAGEDTDHSNEIYLNDGLGYFTERLLIGPVWYRTRDLEWGDIDKDGDLDIAIGNDNWKTVVYLNDPVTSTNGITFTRQISLGTDSSHTTSVAFGDVDGDGDLDLAVGNDGEQNVVYINAGDAYEPDDVCAQASALATDGTAQQHTFHQQADEDWAHFTVVSGTTYVVQAASTSPDADLTLELYDACGGNLEGSDDTAFGTDARLVFTAPSSGTYYVRALNHDPVTYGPDVTYELSVRTHTPRGVAIIVAGRLRADDYRQPIINATANLAYQTFRNGGFPADNILYLNADLGQPGVDDAPSWANVRDAIQDWARGWVAPGVPLWVYLADHGNVDRFHNDVDEVITAAELHLWLSNLEAMSGVDQVNVVIDACHSGSFIDTQQVEGFGQDEISGPGRVVVASTSYRWFAYAPRIVPGQPAPLMYFSDGFWHAVGKSRDIWNAFLAGRATVEAAGQLCGDYAYTCQRPWLDDDGDAWFDEADGDVARGRGLAVAFGEVAPYIDWVEVGEVSEGHATIRAQVRDDGSVARVWARVFAPSFAPPESTDGSIPVIEVPEEDLTAAGDDVYQAEYAGFTENGVYQVVVYAVDDEENAGMPRWVFAGETAVYLPLVLSALEEPVLK